VSLSSSVGEVISTRSGIHYPFGDETRLRVYPLTDAEKTAFDPWVRVNIYNRRVFVLSCVFLCIFLHPEGLVDIIRMKSERLYRGAILIHLQCSPASVHLKIRCNFVPYNIAVILPHTIQRDDASAFIQGIPFELL
jgi:hypothetical protein